MKKLLLAVLAMSAASMALADGIVGKWRTVDDATKKPTGVVQITESGGVYSGRIVAVAEGVDPNCGQCSDAQKGQPLVGKVVLRGLRADGDGYSGGKITDPKNGKTYSAKAKIINDGKALQVRGFLGVSVLGRTQTWHRVP